MIDVISLARQHGFDDACLVSASPTQPPQGAIHPQAASLVDDPRQILPTAQSVLMCAKAYRPFDTPSRDGWIDAYYPASNFAHQASGHLAESLRSTGIDAAATYALRIKPLCARAGLGDMGKNGLIAWGEFGTRVAIQTVVTSLPPDVTAALPRHLDNRCRHCDACVRACPTHALTGDGGLDVTRCLRAQPEGDPLPESMRPLIGGSIMGCDICQRICPRNANVPCAQPDDALTDALRLDRLLAGDYKSLIPWLGSNNARKKRIMNRAALAAANLNRHDLLPLLESLRSEPGALGEHAAWAVHELSTKS